MTDIIRESALPYTPNMIGQRSPMGIWFWAGAKKTVSLTSVRQELRSIIQCTESWQRWPWVLSPEDSVLFSQRPLGRPDYERWKRKHSTPTGLWSEREPHRLLSKQFLGFQNSLGQWLCRSDNSSNHGKYSSCEANPTPFPTGESVIKSFRSERVNIVCC